MPEMDDYPFLVFFSGLEVACYYYLSIDTRGTGDSKQGTSTQALSKTDFLSLPYTGITQKNWLMRVVSSVQRYYS